MENTVNRLIDKSIESFLMAIEVYNKPTIHYRIEGFSMFICNAWELLLKAHMMNTQGERSIYYKDNPNRTLSLENCIEKVFTNRKAPLRLNLEKIIELRNTSTHFITEEYEMVYVPLFQSCVFNYTEKLHDFFGIEANKYVPQNFLTLTVSMRPLDVEEIRAKYPPELANRLLQASADIQSLSAEEKTQHLPFALNTITTSQKTKTRQPRPYILTRMQRRVVLSSRKYRTRIMSTHSMKNAVLPE